MQNYIQSIRSKVGHDKIILAFAGGCIFNSKGEVLLQRRGDTDKWGFPGGAIELGETPQMAAVREAKEETGLDVKAGKIIGVYTDLDITYPSGDRAQSIVIAYELINVGGELFCDHIETSELRYFPKDNKPQLFTKSHDDLWNDIFGDMILYPGITGTDGNLRRSRNMHYDIVALPKDQWKGTVIPLVTRSDSYYDFEIGPLNSEGCTVSIVRKTAENDIVHTPEEYDYPDSLYQDHWEGAEAYGVVSDDGEMMACIEVCPEEWSNRLMVTELWVSDALRGKGIGKRLMDKAKEIAQLQKRRAIILETQSCNTNAIGFYLHQGFELIGFDTCCYTNNDIGRREVRINLGYFFHREGRRR